MGDYMETLKQFKFLGSHSGVDAHSSLLGCYAVNLG